LVIAATYGFSGLSGCTSETDQGLSAKLVKVTLAENPVPVSALTILAKQNGYFRDQGLDVEVKRFTSGKLCLDAVLGGGADFATVAETPLVFVGFTEQKVYVITTIEWSNNNIKVLARKDGGITKPQDLRGKRVATFVGTSAEFFLSAFLGKYALSLKDVSVTNLKPPDMVTAITRGDLDAYAIWEPYIYDGKRQLGDKGLVFEARDIYVETFNIAIKQDFALGHPELVEKFLQALLKAERYIAEKKEEAIAKVADSIGMDRVTLGQIWGDFNFGLVLDQSLLTYMSREAEWATQTGTSPPGRPIPDYKHMIYDSPLKRIQPHGVTLD
jgi:NitT/TauT family transport system substrate-binding protein